MEAKKQELSLRRAHRSSRLMLQKPLHGQVPLRRFLQARAALQCRGEKSRDRGLRPAGITWPRMMTLQLSSLAPWSGWKNCPKRGRRGRCGINERTSESHLQPQPNLRSVGLRDGDCCIPYRHMPKPPEVPATLPPCPLPAPPPYSTL